MTDNFILRVDCPDRPGLVAAVAGLLHTQGCNIEDAAQFNDHHSGRFFMRVLYRHLPVSGGPDAFRAAFGAMAAPLGMDWDIHPVAEKIKTLVLVSKADHCLNDILYRVRTDHLPLDIRAVAGNHDTCRGLTEHHDLPYHRLPDGKAAQEATITRLIEDAGTELIVLARYMQILSDDMCRRYDGRIINIHHSFLPGFKGAKPYHQAWERGVKIIGATAHFVTPDLDEGPIIEQQTARIDHAATPESMRVLGQDIEAQVLSRALQYYAERRIFRHGNRTVIL